MGALEGFYNVMVVVKRPGIGGIGVIHNVNSETGEMIKIHFKIVENYFSAWTVPEAGTQVETFKIQPLIDEAQQLVGMTIYFDPDCSLVVTYLVLEEDQYDNPTEELMA